MGWLYTLWFGYVWPSLKGNGPEAVVQTIVYGAIAMAVYPPLRKWSRAEITKVHHKLDGHHRELLKQAERHHKAQLAAIRKAVPTKGAK